MPDRPTQARARELAADLRAHLRGEVGFSAGDRALYSTDSSNYRQMPAGVVRPRDVDDLVETVRICRDHDAPLTLRGAATSLAGQTTNTAVIVDVSRHLRGIGEIDPERRTVRVQPGVVLDELQRAAAPYGLMFGPDPATHDRCTVGGMIGNDSCGAHSIVAGRTGQNVEALDILTYDGLRLNVGRRPEPDLETICAETDGRGALYRQLRELRDRYADSVRSRFPRLPRLVSGFALDALLPENGFDMARSLVGTEGTCAVVLEATLRLVESPKARALLVLGFDDVFEAADRSPEIMKSSPIALEGFDDRLVEACRVKRMNLPAIDSLPVGSGWLLVEFGGGTVEQAAGLAEAAAGKHRHRVVTDAALQTALWSLRESAVGATAVVPGRRQKAPGWEDSAVPPERLGDYMRDLAELNARFGFDRTFYGHFGDGCLHMRTDFEFSTAAGRADFRGFLEQAADLVVRFGGSLSGEHGDGQARGELLERMYGPELVGAFREFKSIWDPRGRMNPGKVVGPLPLDADLRAARPLARPVTLFPFAADGGSFGQALSRCVGVGKCRRESGGAMCPTYQTTHEERHSTRGRARLLWEMLDGEVVTDLWRSEAVREALELCIACKACSSDCPTSVDMATYKAEFMTHHYSHRLRPRSAYAMGFIHTWARLASRMPRLVNALGGAPGFGSVARFVAGVDGHRRLPKFARQTFRRSLPADVLDVGRGAGPDRVVLFADTFTDAFAPSQGMAALQLLRAAGFTVEVPRGDLCCGRPLYDRGFLAQARAGLARILDAFEPAISAGTPVIVLEPSCEATFHDELLDLFPDDPRARRLSELVCGQGAFIAARPDRFGPVLGRLFAPAVVHGHCHQKATVGLEADLAVLRSLGLSPTLPEPGCCGMAGAFGFERGEHYELSVQIGERNLLPAVRSAPDDALVVANGFSCREQIRQSGGRHAVHLAEVLSDMLTTDPAKAEAAGRAK